MKQPGFLKRRTKIVCTIGPVTGSASVIERLIKSGMNVARLNLSHGTLDEHASFVHAIRNLSQRMGMNVAILIDLPGPKYRTGKLRGGRAGFQEPDGLARGSAADETGIWAQRSFLRPGRPRLSMQMRRASVRSARQHRGRVRPSRRSRIPTFPGCRHGIGL